MRDYRHEINKGGRGHEAPGFSGLPIELHKQLLRLVAVILVAGLGVGTLAGVTTAARNQPTILVQAPLDPDELTRVEPEPIIIAGLRQTVRQAFFEGAPERLELAMFDDIEAAGSRETRPLQKLAPQLVTQSGTKPGTPAARARIAIIIDDLGLHPRRSKQIADLPARLTLSWLPYANNLKAQSRYGHKQGHQTFAHIPMQPGGDEDPGPGALLTWHSRQEIKTLLDDQLSDIEGLSGVNNHMGSKFTSNIMSMSWFMAEVKARDLLFVDSVTSGSSKGAEVAKAHGLPFLERDFFIDHDAKGNLGLIKRRLADLEALALARGEVIAIGHPYLETITGLQDWIPQAQARGIEFVAVSQLEAATRATIPIQLVQHAE